MDYESIDLGRWCNAPADAAAINVRIGGTQEFRGLPFTFPEDSNRCFIALGGDGPTNELEIPLDGRIAFNLVFLHRLLESDILDGGPVGRRVASYSLRFADGTTARREVRERFEIGLPRSWIRDHPALALPDQKHQLPPRFAGEFSRAGRRPTGVTEASSSLYVWAWRNPHPARPIERLTVIPDRVRFLIAGLTLGHVDESPLVPAASRPLRIEVLGPIADQPFNLEVEVDRGYAGYPYPLPREEAVVFLRSAWPGFGEASILGAAPSEGLGPYVKRQPNSPAYVHVAATPSSTVTIRHAEDLLGQVRFSDLTGGTATTSGAIRVQMLGSDRNWVRTTVVDADTKLPIPCRIHFRSREGVPYQPHGHHHQVATDAESWHADVGGDVRLGRVSYAYINGECEGWLPRGSVIVDVARGFEYEPLRSEVEIAPGQRRLRLELKRWRSMDRERWFAGDTHVHFVSSTGAHLEAGAEGLNVVNLLMTQAGDLFSGFEDFEGRPAISQRAGTVVYVGQENRQHFLGHLSLLGLKNEVLPISSAGSTEAELGGSMETTLAHWADECHAQGGTVILPHLPVPNGEPAALIATGRVDAVEMCEHKMYFHREYYRYLNCGYRLPLVGGTDKMSAEVPMGLFRTYAYIPPEKQFTYQNWCDALKQGCTFLSSGPLVNFAVEGMPIGSTVHLPVGGGSVDIEAATESIFPIHSLELVERGQVVAAASDARGSRRLSLHERVAVREDTWFAVRVGARNYGEPNLFADAWARGVMAHSSPIYVACGDQWSMADRNSLEYMVTLVDLGLAYVKHMRLQENDRSVTHRHGEDDHERYLTAPFHEAAAALRGRLNPARTRQEV